MLFGAAAAHRVAFDTPLPLIAQADNERGIAAARAQLDDVAFNAAWNAGQAMTLEEAVKYALKED
jgi:hypothetical protein